MQHSPPATASGPVGEPGRQGRVGTASKRRAAEAGRRGWSMQSGRVVWWARARLAGREEGGRRWRAGRGSARGAARPLPLVLLGVLAGFGPLPAQRPVAPAGGTGAALPASARAEGVALPAPTPAAGVALATTPGRALAAGGADCLRCHALPNLGYRDSAGAAPRSFTVAPDRYRTSAHGKLACRQCHADIDSFPHPPSAARRRVACDGDCHAVDSTGAPYTHGKIAGEFRASAHGDSLTAGPSGRRTPGRSPDDPTCLGCHGAGDAHSIVPVAKVSRATRMGLCVGCHDDRAMMARHGVSPGAVTSYRRSFHYKAVHFGEAGTAICTDCHTAHHILPAADPRASIAPAALTRTCGQARCHEGAGHAFAVSGANHLDLRVEREPLLWLEEKFFLLLTAGTMLMLLVGIVLDVQRKFGWLALGRRAARRLAGAGGALDRLRPALVRSGRRGLRLARQLLVD